MAYPDCEVETSTVNQETIQSQKGGVAMSDKSPAFKRGPRFWAIISTLCVIGLLSALENTVVTTSLPYIVTELDLGRDYIWVTNVFFLTRQAFKPLISPFSRVSWALTAFEKD